MSDNPYEAPQFSDTPSVLDTDAEEVRKEHIKTEASIKSVGILYFLGGVFLLVAGIRSLSNSPAAGDVTGLENQVTAVLFVILGIFQFIVGVAVRKLRQWSRIGIGIVSGLGLLALPIGTLINAYILYLAFGRKGKMVLSPEYKEIIAATPHIKYRTPKVVWIILGGLVAIIALGIAAIALSS